MTNGIGHTAVTDIQASSVTFQVWQPKESYCIFATFNRLVLLNTNRANFIEFGKKIYLCRLLKICSLI